MIQEKSDRLCSKRYKIKHFASALNRDHAGRYVYPHDAEDIKSHRWFKDIPWDKIHLMTPPFVPAIKTADNTQYFDEEDPISDFSSSHDSAPGLSPPTEDELEAALRCFNSEIKILARSYVMTAYDSTRLRKIEHEIDAFCMGDEQKDYLRGFVRAYGRKEKKRPRDRLLRDKEVAKKVLEERKRGAFLGYSYRRIRRGSVGDVGMRATVNVSNGKGKSSAVWGRGRISMFKLWLKLRLGDQ
jgi:protein-serine/threonine kinase